MNLSALAGGYVATVNPWVTAQYLQNAGTYTTANDGKRTPTYLDAEPMAVQMQALSDW